MRLAFFTLNAYEMLAGEAQNHEIGGAQLQQILIGKELAERGHEVFFIEYTTEYKEDQTIDGIQIVQKPRPTGTEVSRALNVITGTNRIIKRIEPDICYRRSLDFEILALSFLCRVQQPSFVYGIAHDNNLDLVPSTFTSGIKSSRLYGRLNRLALSKAAAVVTQNEYQFDKANELLSTNVYKLTNCYRPNCPRPIPALHDSDELVVLWVARFTEFKRPKLALDLASKLPDVQFVLIGKQSDERLFQEVKAEADEYDNVRFEGFVPFSEIDRYFVSADVFLNTSSAEGYPNTFLQAWAYGSPVLSLNVNPDEVLTRERIGWAVNDDIDEARTILSDLSADPDELSRIGERASQYFHEHHDVESVVDGYEAMFQEIVSLD